jgi:hypothetical protein
MLNNIKKLIICFHICLINSIYFGRLIRISLFPIGYYSLLFKPNDLILFFNSLKSPVGI